MPRISDELERMIVAGPPFSIVIPTYNRCDLVSKAIASALDGGCVAPMGAYARLEGDGLDGVCEELSLDGRRQARVRETIPVKDHEYHALRLAEKLAACGGRDLVEEAKRELRR